MLVWITTTNKIMNNKIIDRGLLYLIFGDGANLLI
ncbi:hypothetical protein KLPMMMO235B2_25115 [Klebsiella pneumoniae]